MKMFSYSACLFACIFSKQKLSVGSSKNTEIQKLKTCLSEKRCRSLFINLYFVLGIVFEYQNKWSSCQCRILIAISNCLVLLMLLHWWHSSDVSYNSYWKRQKSVLLLRVKIWGEKLINVHLWTVSGWHSIIWNSGTVNQRVAWKSSSDLWKEW